MFMTQKKLRKIIELYYLSGLTEQVRFKVKDNQLTINFKTDLKDCIGEIKSKWEIDDVELGVYDSTQLYKLLKICNDPIQIDIIKKDDKAQKLEIKDNQFDLSYNLGDLGLISEGRLTNEMPEPSITLKLDQEFISKFKSAHVALEKVEVFSIQPKTNKQKEKTLEFIIGLQERYANKITFTQPVELYNELPKFIFKVSNFKEILNNSSGEDIIMNVYSMGIVSISVKEEDVDVLYYLVPQSN